jgi:hypothetical protein
MAALSWEEIVERGKKHNKTVICEVEKTYHRRFKIKCLTCLNESIMSLKNLSYGKTCQKCYHLSESKEQALIHADKYNVKLLSYVGKEIDGRHRWLIQCKKCKNSKESFIRDFDKCGVCRANNQRSTLEYFIDKSKNIHGNKYNYDLVIYKNSLTKIKIFCNRCNKIFFQTPSMHLVGNGCMSCSGFKKYTKDEFELKAKDFHGDRYNYDLVKYINTDTKVKIFCNRCTKIFLQSPHGHLRGQGCPRCKFSKGEIRVAKTLNNLKIFFEDQKIFESLKFSNHLRFDFYLPELNLLVEYDGEFHYKALMGTTPEKKQKNLEDCQRNDKIKNEWAKANNIPLLRIPYWDFDRIEELIEAFILQHTKKKEIKQLVLEM